MKGWEFPFATINTGAWTCEFFFQTHMVAKLTWWFILMPSLPPPFIFVVTSTGLGDLVSPSYVELWRSMFFSLTLASVAPSSAGISCARLVTLEFGPRTIP